ncbi:MAG: hypothetical protein ACETWG_02870 [Candidatus Neomarinimicrobiota bacterium]
MTTHKIPKLTVILIILAIMAVWFIACEPPAHPPSLFDPDEVPRPDPVITHVIPVGSARIAKDTLRISGENFSPILEENIFYIAGIQAPIDAASDTLLKLLAPRVQGDSMDIHIAVRGALRFAVWENYTLRLR